MNSKVEELTEHVNVGRQWNQVGIQLKLESKVLMMVIIADKVSATYKLWLKANPSASRRGSIETKKHN